VAPHVLVHADRAHRGEPVGLLEQQHAPARAPPGRPPPMPHEAAWRTPRPSSSPGTRAAAPTSPPARSTRPCRRPPPQDHRSTSVSTARTRSGARAPADAPRRRRRAHAPACAATTNAPWHTRRTRGTSARRASPART
jgi:hypothetical protein